VRLNRETCDDMVEGILGDISDYVNEEGMVHYRKLRYVFNLNTEDALLLRDVAKDEILKNARQKGVEPRGSDLDIVGQYYLVVQKEGMADEDVKVKAYFRKTYTAKLAKIADWKKLHGLQTVNSVAGVNGEDT